MALIDKAGIGGRFSEANYVLSSLPLAGPFHAWPISSTAKLRSLSSRAKQPDPAPKKRVTAKANASKLLPKPLRNPKTHPELLADETHAKTQKQPDPAQGDPDTAKAQKRAKRRRDPEKEPF
jgi:hypothetical protein